MADMLQQQVREILEQIELSDPDFAVHVADRLLALADQHNASDLHLNPSELGLEVRYRIDGILRRVGHFPREAKAKIVGRFKVLAGLLTYRTDIPQEGRCQPLGRAVAVRISSFPSLYGERVVVRFFGRSTRFRYVADLGLPEDVESELRRLLSETAGTILVTGPAGSGKTTTVYACLREILSNEAVLRNVVTLEDPIEVAVAGAIQSQVDVKAGLDLGTGLRFLMRHDPEVIFVGEIRDRVTAEAAVQASFTGHLLLSTFHAGSAAEALGRLLDMGIEPYLLRSSLLGVVSQRLLRRLCDCAEWREDEQGRLGLPIERFRVPVGCEACGQSGFRDRVALAELLLPDDPRLSAAVLNRCDVQVLQESAEAAGMVNLRTRACRLAAEGVTSPGEVRRVLGLGRFSVHGNRLQEES